jgi:hypothetical protein
VFSRWSRQARRAKDIAQADRARPDGRGAARRLVPRRMDLGKQAANAVAGLRDLRGEIVIEAAQHGEFGERLVGQSKRAQRMRHRAGGLGNDGGVTGVSLGFACMQIGNAAHGQTRQIGDQNTFVSGDSHGQRADGGRLIDAEQELAVCLELGDKGTQFGLIVR